jgi:hypothetical protein
VDLIAQSAILDKLPYAADASWKPEQACLPNTRAALLEDIWKWIDTADVKGTASIFCLTSVAGAGKSAIAHTVAQRCHDEGVLASSFFFNREVAGRNDPKMLFSTIARDLAGRSKGLCEQISLAIESDRSLATATISRQFGPLILAPCLRYPADRPAVIVIDALDEGYNNELLKILRDEFPKLPGTFRIFLTFRVIRDINKFMSQVNHVRLRSIDIHERTNLEDIAIYIKHELKNVAELQELGDNWPDRHLADEFTRKAEGLFLWVATVSQYLCHTIYPDNKLRLFLSNSAPTGLPAEKKMDDLYATILHACDWDDDDFVEGYGLVMGAILAAKTPLSMSALQSLHRTTPALHVVEVVPRLSSLLTGLTDKKRPVQILHLSLRDFLTIRAQLSQDYKQFCISEKEHSQRLALLCLTILNEDLKQDTPGVGYLAGDSPDIPKMTDGDISEELLYACRFWMDHIVEVEAPVPSLLIEALHRFLSTQLISWIEILTAKDKFQKLLELRKWVQVGICARIESHGI